MSHRVLVSVSREWAEAVLPWIASDPDEQASFAASIASPDGIPEGILHAGPEYVAHRVRYEMLVAARDFVPGTGP
jgi:hypothetical protein